MTLLLVGLLLSQAPSLEGVDGGATSEAEGGGAPTAESEAPAPVADAGSVDEASLTTVVTGTRARERLADTPIPTEVITRAVIQESGSRDLAEALRVVPGVETYSAFASAISVRMQGLGPEYNLLIVDGQRATGRVNGGINLSRYGAEDIDQIEIVKGPGSVLWGSDAIAGVIQVVTHRPDRSFGISGLASYGSFNQIDARASAEGLVGDFGLTGSVAFTHRDEIPTEGSLATSGSAITGIQATTRATYGDFRGGGLYADVHLAGSFRLTHGVEAPAAGGLFDFSTGDRLLEGSGLVRVPVGPGTLTLNAGVNSWQERYVYDQRNGTALDTQEDNLDRNETVTATYATTLGQHSLIGGLDLLAEQVSATARLEGNDRARERGSVFVQDEWQVSGTPRLVAVGGVRADFDTQFGSALTPRLAVRYDPVDRLTLRAAVGTGFRAPSFQELYLTWDNISAGYRVRGNPALAPEHSVAGTLAVDWEPVRGLTLSGSAFWNQLWNMIGYVSTPGEILYVTYSNFSRAVSRGVEASAAWSPNRFLTLGAGYTYTYARDLAQRDPKTGDYLELDGQAAHRVVSQVRFRVKEWGLTAFVRAAWTSARPVTDGETLTYYTAPFLLVDARIGWRVFKHFELFVTGDNLTDSGKDPDFPLPPRSFFGGVAVTY
jgi:outer membrane receptor for ferrienterochelin and colicins